MTFTRNTAAVALLMLHINQVAGMKLYQNNEQSLNENQRPQQTPLNIRAEFGQDTQSRSKVSKQNLFDLLEQNQPFIDDLLSKQATGTQDLESLFGDTQMDLTNMEFGDFDIDTVFAESSKASPEMENDLISFDDIAGDGEFQMQPLKMQRVWSDLGSVFNEDLEKK